MKKLTFIFAVVLTILGTKTAFAQYNGTSAAFDFKNATNYYLLYLDPETTNANIAKSDIKKDYRVDDVTHFLYVWSQTYTSNDAVGPNSNGVTGSFLDFTVGNQGWSGFGFAGVTPGKDMTGIDDTYYLHFSMKATDATAHVSHAILINSDANNFAKFTIGKTAFVDNGTSYKVLGDFARDGEWYNFDIPMSTLSKMGCKFTDTQTTGNVFAMLSGGVTGTEFCLDAVFFYQKKNGTAINNVASDNVQVNVGENSITIEGSNAGIKLYDISGKCVASTTDSSVSTVKLAKGVYILKSGSVTKKVVIK